MKRSILFHRQKRSGCLYPSGIVGASPIGWRYVIIMAQDRVVVYVQSIDEATEQLQLPLEDPHNGEDWGLVAEGGAYVRIRFVYSNETVRIAKTAYDRLRVESGVEEFTVANATQEILNVGADAILDLKHGQVPLDGIENTLEEAVATVFAMQANQGEIGWPAIPDQVPVEDGKVPSISAVEPVYPDLDAGTSRWVTCELKWNPSRGVFENRQASSEWELDDEAAADATYTVHGEEYSTLNEAMQAALEGTQWEGKETTVVVDPRDEETPEWGVAV
jgi:hypothetical protein